MSRDSVTLISLAPLKNINERWKYPKLAEITTRVSRTLFPAVVEINYTDVLILNYAPRYRKRLYAIIINPLFRIFTNFYTELVSLCLTCI